MIEIRIHGRGGQGAVIASQILARAAFHKGLYVQAFPQFGVERRGAPVLSFARLSEEPIRLRSAVYKPHHTMVLDAALIEHTDVTQGLRPEGWIVINSPQPPQSFSLNQNWNLATVDATTIAAANGIGTLTQPIVNTTMVGALVRVTGIVHLKDLEWAFSDTFKKRVEANQKATREAYEKVMMSTAIRDRVPSVSR
jgi:pyruvate ferredoxin oxidoreductase gamma subunit/2-oxoisovalerate ferredoxin oxidoreductase gamma subunit